MAGGDRAFEARLYKVRQDFERLRCRMGGLAAEVRTMRASSRSWRSAVDALQTHRDDCMRRATALAGELMRVVAEAESLIVRAPRPDRSLRVGQKPTPSTGVRSELGGKVRRLLQDAAALDRDLRAYHATVRGMATDLLRHAGGLDPIDAISELIGQVGTIAEIARGFLGKRLR